MRVVEGGDDDNADNEEESDAEGFVFEEGCVIGGAEFDFDAVKVDVDDEECGESARDLVSIRGRPGVLRGIHTGAMWPV